MGFLTNRQEAARNSTAQHPSRDRECAIMACRPGKDKPREQAVRPVRDRQLSEPGLCDRMVVLNGTIGPCPIPVGRNEFRG